MRVYLSHFSWREGGSSLTRRTPTTAPILSQKTLSFSAPKETHSRIGSGICMKQCRFYHQSPKLAFPGLKEDNKGQHKSSSATAPKPTGENKPKSQNNTPHISTNIAALRLSVDDNFWHATPGMKLTPQFHMPSLFVDAHNPPPAIPSDVHITYGWFRGSKMETVQQGMVAHARPEKKDAPWTKVSSRREYTPTAADAMHILKFVIYADHKPGKAFSAATASNANPPPSAGTTTYPESTGPVIAGKYTYFIAPTATKAPTRQMIPRNSDFEVDVLPAEYNFTAMSWNVLARRYTDRQRLSNCPDYALDWNYRKDIILEENLLTYLPDLIALQECENDAYEGFYQPQLKVEGYGTVFEKRGSVLHDGCAMFYKKSKFRHISSYRVDFDDLDGDKDLLPLQFPSATLMTHNVAVISLFEVKHAVPSLENVYGKRFLWALNAHNFWDPLAPHIKLLQGHVLIEKLKSLQIKLHESKAIPLDTPIVFMGDLNSGHKTALYEYVTKGQLTSPSLADHKIKDLTRAKTFQHRLQLKNAHQAQGEAVTNLTINFAGCLDYIFHSPNIIPVAVLENPTTSDNEALRQSIMTNDYMGCIPNPSYPSDHLPLMVKFAFSLNPHYSL